MTFYTHFFFVLILISAFGCKNKLTDNQIRKDSLGYTVKVSSVLSHYNIEDENARYYKLSDELKEISGICFTDDGRLFCQTDEYADIFQIDQSTGRIIKTFYINDESKQKAIKGDFEDITFVGNQFFLARHSGTLYSFHEGYDKQIVSYQKYKTSLNSLNDIEGLCFDSSTNSLLMVCKSFAGDGYENQRAVYSFDLAKYEFVEKPRFLININEIKNKSVEEKFKPSGIAKCPSSNSFFIIAAKGNIIIEISDSGEVIDYKNLPQKIHIQPEGISFSKDKTLYISNEGKNDNARLVIYLYQP